MYFFLRGNPIQFKVTAIMTVCWDAGKCVLAYFGYHSTTRNRPDIDYYTAVLAQRIFYGSAPPSTAGMAHEAEESGRLHVAQ